MTATVSVVIITKNEAANITRCLRSVEWAGERIVVDSGSNDGTAEIAASLGARVLRRAWPGYGPQKNFGISQARYPWILSLDADEEVSPRLAEEIQSTLAADAAEAAYVIFIPTYFLGHELRHYGRARRDPGHIRLFRRGRGVFDERVLHESVVIDGPVGVLSAPINHYCYPTGRSYWRKIHYYAPLEAEARIAGPALHGGPLLRTTGKFGWMMFWRRGILGGPAVWLWIAGQAYQEWLTTRQVQRLRRQSGESRAHAL